MAAVSTLSAMYEMKVNSSAARVPKGMLRDGFFSSPGDKVKKILTQHKDKHSSSGAVE